VVAQTENLGKGGKVFASVCYFDGIAYCLPFQILDPLYIVNMTDPLKPKSEFVYENVTGLNSDLHPMNSANTLMLAIGEETNKTTVIPSGLQLTVFDASNPLKLVTLQCYVVKSNKYDSPSSGDFWDFTALHYTSFGDGIGIVTIPFTSIGNWNESSNSSFVQIGNSGGSLVFDGFVLFDVNKTGIVECICISNVNSADMMGCYSNVKLPLRVFAHGGDLMTLMDNSINATNYTSGDQNWNLTLPSSENLNKCML
jgi:Beta propeller domain